MRTTSKVEQWKDVAGFEGYYAVSNLGRVRRIDDHPKSKKGVLAATANRFRYLTVHLSADGKKKRCKLHILVMLAFASPRPTGMQVAHNDGNRSNNCLSNLRWDTPKGNTADKHRHGTHQSGERHGMHILREPDIHEIDQLRDGGETFVGIAKRFGLANSSVARRAYCRIAWKHVPKAA